MVDTKKKKTTRKVASKKSGTTTSSRKAATAKSKSGSRKATTARSKATTRKAAPRAEPESSPFPEQQIGSLFESISDLTTSAMKFASKTRKRAARAKDQASSKIPSPDQLRKMANAGESLRDLREVAGLTLADITTALKLKDKSVLEAVEDGKEALSMEMIMRLASLYARNDPIPFVVNYVRTYRPKLWEVMEEWGLDGLPVKMERDRRFMNIYKRRDAARQLSSEGFEKVLAFTQEAFELALHFIAELEEIENDVNHEFDDIDSERDSQDQ